MFVERQRGQVGLTVGPFSGGMHAAHTISVFEEGGKIRVVDRVRLSKEEESLSLGSMLLCGIFETLKRQQLHSMTLDLTPLFYMFLLCCYYLFILLFVFFPICLTPLKQENTASGGPVVPVPTLGHGSWKFQFSRTSRRK